MHSIAQSLDPVAWGSAILSGWGGLDRTQFWFALAKLIWINILLSGDNAVVIAMACRALPRRQRFLGMALGAGVAVILRMIFTGAVATLMLLSYVKIISGLALLYIAAKLLVPDEPERGVTGAGQHLWRAVRIVAFADIVMSMDNVIAIAAAAQGNIALLVLGLVISIPLIVAGAALIVALLDRLPVLIWAGAALLGWIAGKLIATDHVVTGYIATNFSATAVHGLVNAAGGVGAVLVLIAGGLWRWAKRATSESTSSRV